MAGEGRLSEVRVKRRYLGWIRKVDRRREGTKTRRSGKTRRNSSVWEEITCWRILKGRLFWPPSCGGGGGLDLRLSGRLLGVLLGPSELSIASSAVLD